MIAVAPVQRSGRRIATMLTAGAVVLLVAVPATLAADPVVTFSSGTDWTASDAAAGVGPDLSLPGAAQHVCLNASAPSPCPAGATEYGWPGGGWSSDLSSIPGATWIWAPGITSTTEPADDDAYRFQKTVAVPGTPTGGTLSVAADDGATVYVNGTMAGGTTGPDQLATIDIGQYLVAGDNTIAVVGVNGTICNETCTYQRNPGGVAFGGSISYTAAVPSQSAGPTSRPIVSTPPTSTVDPATAPSGAPGLALVLLGVAATVAMSVNLRRRAGRRQR